MSKGGTLVPPWYDAPETSKTGLLVAAFFYGASVAVTAFDSSKAVRQSNKRWRCNNRAKVYIIMVWAVIVSCMITSLCIWLFLLGIIPPSVWYFVGMLFTWVIQTQCLMQILANRLSLIMYNPVRERWLKVGLLVAIGLINISVFIIWVPARLQISWTWIYINEIWDRIEKALYSVIDLALNGYFMWLVKSTLVAGGLSQYNVLWKYNLAMVCVSISLDVMLIGLMSLPDNAVYVQVHPLVYLTKLNIEMNMADLIGKVVKRSTESRSTLPSTDVWRPHLAQCTFDREWLGRAKNFFMPSTSAHEMGIETAGDTNNTHDRWGDQRHDEARRSEPPAAQRPALTGADERWELQPNMESGSSQTTTTTPTTMETSTTGDRSIEEAVGRMDRGTSGVAV